MSEKKYVFYIALPFSILLLLLALFSSENRWYLSGPNEFHDWMRWVDQRFYVVMPEQILNLGINSDNFRYGWGYPVLALPFAAWENPYYFVGPLTFLIFVVSSLLVFKATGFVLSGFIAAGMAILCMPFTEYFLIPWSNSLSAMAIPVLLLLGIYSKNKNILLCFICGLLLGLVFASRYIDAVFLFLMPLFYFNLWNFNFIKQRHLRVQIAAFCFSFLILVLATLFVHYKIYGNPLITPYRSHKVELIVDGKTVLADDQSLSIFKFSESFRNLYEVWIAPPDAEREIYGKSAIFEILPILFACPLGFILAIYREKRFRKLLIGALFSFVMWNFFYGAYYLTYGELKFKAYRYVFGWFPFLIFLAIWPIEWLIRKMIFKYRNSKSRV